LERAYASCGDGRIVREEWARAAFLAVHLEGAQENEAAGTAARGEVRQLAGLVDVVAL
jgi:hypothetical protein